VSAALMVAVSANAGVADEKIVARLIARLIGAAAVAHDTKVPPWYSPNLS
jgi:hypothetical protein